MIPYWKWALIWINLSISPESIEKQNKPQQSQWSTCIVELLNHIIKYLPVYLTVTPVSPGQGNNPDI